MAIYVPDRDIGTSQNAPCRNQELGLNFEPTTAQHGGQNLIS